MILLKKLWRLERVQIVVSEICASSKHQDSKLHVNFPSQQQRASNIKNPLLISTRVTVPAYTRLEIWLQKAPAARRTISGSDKKINNTAGAHIKNEFTVLRNRELLEKQL
jgi:hypothetical protein